MKTAFATLITFFLLTAGCSHRAGGSYVADYESAQERLSGSETLADLSPFIELYTRLSGDDVADRVRRVYASELFFNDTLHSANNVDELALYMAQTAERADEVDVAILNHWQSGQDVFVRWTMTTRFTVLGKQREARSIGMTHLRFDDNGQVILHQDFWDSAEGFYRHVPVSGHAINWIRRRL